MTAWFNDEGYADDESKMTDVMPTANILSSNTTLPDYLKNLTESQRTEIAYALIKTLPTRQISNIVNHLDPLLHIDPVPILPFEITSQILSHLDIPSLLSVSTLSKSWRVRASDPWLWKQLFLTEGWKPTLQKVAHFEQAQREREAEKQRSRPSVLEDSASPRKKLRSALDQDVSIPNWSSQHDTPEADEDDRMEDIMNDDDSSSASALQDSSVWPPAKPSLLLNEPGVAPRMNWQYLYKQKRRLEKNWQRGRYTTFQLPHPSYPHEAHAECVYTIQYSGKYLVSGSRDHTLRIWAFDTQRLVGQPLKGHSASVLCLQFDPSPEQDIIISGGSDCHVIIWRFSTGKIIRKLREAHAESVLNLKFDDRYLVTCSKDRTIKIWNRKALLPTDKDYPLRGSSNLSHVYFPDYIINQQDISAALSRHIHFTPLPEYSLLMTLQGHTAAVNALQILENQIVSASGDRYIKIWDLQTGQILRTLSGHDKGIACVQFDGRRIVSGSSDETIRIFDAKNGAELALLKGHTGLVRTVQASFVDTHAGAVESETNAQLQRRSALKNEKAVRMPDGGGGTRWARIVSGSYDESIIIWQRNAEGSWVPAHRLNQWEAILAAGGQPRFIPLQSMLTGHAQTQRVGHQLRQIRHTLNQASASLGAFAQALSHSINRNAGPDGLVPNTREIAENLESIPTVSEAMSTSTSASHPIGERIRRHVAHVSNSVSTDIAQNLSQQAQHMSAQAQQLAQQAGQIAQDSEIQRREDHQLTLAPQHSSTSSAHLVQTLPVSQTATLAHPVQSAQSSTAAAQPPVARVTDRRRSLRRANLNQNSSHHSNIDNNRVYKLQFDARRIICCSQDPTIVGWDFANGDREIEIASEFFGDEQVQQ